jgi:ABC-type transporter Mla subunit MlaD
MPLQDLTPELRTRLSRLERAVGWFVALATLAFIAAVAVYLYVLAERRGTFVKKLPYFTFVHDAAGLNVGDKVKLMGFDAGEIVEIEAMAPDYLYFNVYVRFLIREPYYGYLWEDSRAKVAAGDLLGGRVIEVSKGTNGAPTYALWELKELPLTDAEAIASDPKLGFAQEIFSGTNRIAAPGVPVTLDRLKQIAALGSNTVWMADRASKVKGPAGIWDPEHGIYLPVDISTNKGYFLLPVESPSLSQRLEVVADAVENALPVILGFTNQINRVLTNTESLTANGNKLLTAARPVVTNLADLTAKLSGPKGSIGEWLLPTNIAAGISRTLGSAESAFLTSQTNLSAITSNLIVSLEHVASLTSNLNAQVQANGLILSDLSMLIQNTDGLVQGLKRHWLLKNAFAAETNRFIRSLVEPTFGGEQ